MTRTTNQTERGQVAGWNTPHPGMACYCYKDANCGCPNPVEPITHDIRCNRQHENDDHCNTLLPAPQPATETRNQDDEVNWVSHGDNIAQLCKHGHTMHRVDACTATQATDQIHCSRVRPVRREVKP